MVYQPVHRRHGYRAAGEDLVPLPEGWVAGDQQGFGRVAFAAHLKQHRGHQLAAAHVGDLVDQEAHLKRWSCEVADVRLHGTTGEQLVVRFQWEEAAALSPFPSSRTSRRSWSGCG